MAKVLLVYGTAYGQTERIARRLAGGLEGLGHAVSIWKGDELAADLSLVQYEAFVIAASVIRGKHQQYSSIVAARGSGACSSFSEPDRLAP